MKKLIAITVAAIILTFPIQVLAEANGQLFFEGAASMLDLNSSTLKKLQRAENEAYRQYNSNVLEMGILDVNGVHYKINNEDYYYTYDAETKHSLSKMKQLTPEQMKFAWESARDNHTVMQQTLKASLRGIFFSVYSAQSDSELKQKQLELASEINKQEQLKLKKGMITPLDLEESGYNVLKAKNELDTAKRNYDNAVRNFDQFVGLRVNTQFEKIINVDKLSHPVWKSVDFYVEEALANRSDISGIQKQLALKELDKKLTEEGTSYKIKTADQNDYERLLNDIEKLNTDLEEMKLSITNEIKNAFVDVIKAGKSVDSMANTLKLQKSGYEKMQARYKAGLITKNDVTKAGLSLQQTENAYEALVYDYNTRIMRFKNATGIGPGY